MNVLANPREIYSAGKLFEGQRNRKIAVSLLIDPLAEDDLIYELRQAFVPMSIRARVATEVVEPGAHIDVEKNVDFVVVALGPQAAGLEQADETDELVDELKRIVRGSVDAGVPVVLVARAGVRQPIAARYGVGILDVIIGAADDQILDGVAEWCADNSDEAKLALAANFEFARRAVASEFVKATSLQNAVVGGVLFVPGADMPVMTANQVKMVLQIAATYGQPLSAARIKEIAAVIGGAFLLRALARQAIAFLPVVSIPIKAAVGYTGTLAMGRAVVEYFEKGGSIVNLAPDLDAMKDRIVTEADHMRRRMSRKQ